MPKVKILLCSFHLLTFLVSSSLSFFVSTGCNNNALSKWGKLAPLLAVNQDSIVDSSTPDSVASPSSQLPIQYQQQIQHPPARSLDGRLLCASQCSYGIDASAPYFRGVGYRNSSVAKRISRGVNSVLVGRTIPGDSVESDGGDNGNDSGVDGGEDLTITLAFRGTVLDSVPSDWLKNAAYFLTTYDKAAAGESAGKEGERRGGGVNVNGKFKSGMGKVHTGYYRAVKSLWKPLKSVMMDMIAEAKEEAMIQAQAENETNDEQPLISNVTQVDGKNHDRDIIDDLEVEGDMDQLRIGIYLTGHGKGGAMASIAALLIKDDPDLPDPSYVCTFASSRVGNACFRQGYNARVNQTSYEAYGDLVPFLPPSASVVRNMDKSLLETFEGFLWSRTSSSRKDKYVWDYQTVGKRKYIDGQGTVVEPVTKELDEKRIKNFGGSNRDGRTVITTSPSTEQFIEGHYSSCPGGDCSRLFLKAIAGDVYSRCLSEKKKE